MHQHNLKKISPLALISVLIPLLLISSVCFAAQESITLTTYYPAPYGIYRELRADQMAIGSGYRNLPLSGLSDGMLIVEDRVGIGTDEPRGALHVLGGVMPVEEGLPPLSNADDIYLEAQSIPESNGSSLGGDIILYPGNSFLVRDSAGGIGIGTDMPEEILHVITVATDISGNERDIAAIFEGQGTGAYIALKDVDTTDYSTMPRVGAVGDDLHFQVKDGASVDTKMIIQGGSGKVGIGTVDPSGILHVDGGIAGPGEGEGENIIIKAQSAELGTNQDGGNIMLLPGDGDGTLGWTGRVVIDTSGTTTPSGTLNVIQTRGTPGANTAGIVLTRVGGTTGAAGIRFEMEGSLEGNPATQNPYRVSQIYGGLEDGYSNPNSGNNIKGDLRFFTRDGRDPGDNARQGSSNEWMRITSGGNIGIGVSVPESHPRNENENLDVNDVFVRSMNDGSGAWLSEAGSGIDIKYSRSETTRTPKIEYCPAEYPVILGCFVGGTGGGDNIFTERVLGDPMGCRGYDSDSDHGPYFIEIVCTNANVIP